MAKVLRMHRIEPAFQEIAGAPGVTAADLALYKRARLTELRAIIDTLREDQPDPHARPRAEEETGATP